MILNHAEAVPDGKLEKENNIKSFSYGKDKDNSVLDVGSHFKLFNIRLDQVPAIRKYLPQRIIIK